MKKTMKAAAVVGVALSVTGCTATDLTATPTPSATVSVEPGVTQQPGQPLDNDGNDIVLPTKEPDDAALGERAVAALTAYSHRERDYETWFAALKPYLHESAVEAYSTVRPARIPAFTITGPAEIATTSVDMLNAITKIPTSIGTYTLDLKRPTTSSDWTVTAIRPPS